MYVCITWQAYNFYIVHTNNQTQQMLISRRFWNLRVLVSTASILNSSPLRCQDMHALAVHWQDEGRIDRYHFTLHSTAPPGRLARRSGRRTRPSACLWPWGLFWPSRFWRRQTRGPCPSPPRRMSGTVPRQCGPTHRPRLACAASLGCQPALLGVLVSALVPAVLVGLLLLSAPAREWRRLVRAAPGAGMRSCWTAPHASVVANLRRLRRSSQAPETGSARLSDRCLIWMESQSAQARHARYDQNTNSFFPQCSGT